MSLHDFLRTRRSVRRFRPDPIASAVVDRLLATAACAPSAHNLQPWRFVVVGHAGTRPRLARALTEKMSRDMRADGAASPEIEKRVASSVRRIEEAPLLILLCRDVTAVRGNTPEENVMNIQSTALAGLQLLLAAHAEGLAGNWICWPLYAAPETRSVLNLPAHWEPQAMFMIGEAAEVPDLPARRALDEIIANR